MKGVKIIEHQKGSPLFRLIGLGPNFIFVKGIHQLKRLFDDNTFWATNRSQKDIKRMLANSSCVVSAWKEDVLIGFGRATSDSIYRAIFGGDDRLSTLHVLDASENCGVWQRHYRGW